MDGQNCDTFGTRLNREKNARMLNCRVSLFLAVPKELSAKDGSSNLRVGCERKLNS